MGSIIILDTVEELLRAYDAGIHPAPGLLAQLVQQVQSLLEAPVSDGQTMHRLHEKDSPLIDRCPRCC